jgi:hypothetical protein
LTYDITHHDAELLVKEKRFVFDASLSYETTGYRPITETAGLDFDPEPFMVPAATYKKTGHYVDCPVGSRSFMEQWRQDRERCHTGYRVGDYRLTGDNFFFVNYHKMPLDSDVNGAGEGATYGNPIFFAPHYEFFHYLELCFKLKYDAVLVKARGVGASEIVSSMMECPYTVIPNYTSSIVAFAEGFLVGTKGTLSKKTWINLDHLNQDTDGAMAHLRQKYNSDLFKRASITNTRQEELSDSWFSQITGQVVDKPGKLRGDRLDRLVFEESGSNPYLEDTYIVGEALVIVNGTRKGIRIVIGTGGEEGASVAGLERIFLNPVENKVLPVKHNYTKDGQFIESGFFIPAWRTVIKAMDKRGVVDSKKAIDFYTEERSIRMNNPSALKRYCAEYCFYVDEAFALQGENSFDAQLLADAHINLTILKTTRPPEKGFLKWIYKEDGGDSHNKKTLEGETPSPMANVIGVSFHPDPSGDVIVAERPILDKDGNPIHNLYVGGSDSIDFGKNETSASNNKPSDFCQLIKKRIIGTEGNKYVAMYKNRPNDIREAYGNATKLLWWYGAKTNLEWSKTNFYTYLRSLKLANKMLLHRPNLALPSNNFRKVNNLWGTPGNEKYIKHGLELIQTFILESWQSLDMIEMIEQLQKYSYSNKRKFDIVAAMIMAEIADEDFYQKMPVLNKNDNLRHQEWQDIGYYTDSDGRKKYGIIPDYLNPKKNQPQHVYTIDEFTSPL